jgi:hypothetical protein
MAFQILLCGVTKTFTLKDVQTIHREFKEAEKPVLKVDLRAEMASEDMAWIDSE